MAVDGNVISGGLVGMAFPTYSTIAYDGLETVGESRRAMADFNSPTVGGSCCCGNLRYSVRL